MSSASQLAARWFDLAITRHGEGRVQQAAATYMRILAIMPSHAGSHYMLSRIARGVGQRDMALQMLRKAVAAAPREFDYRMDLLNVLQEAGHTEEEAAHLQEACLLWPDRAELHFRRASLLRAAGRTAEAGACTGYAADCLSATIAVRPDDAEAHYRLGLCLRLLNRPEAAAGSLADALRLQPDMADAHDNLGLALLALGRLEEAESSFREALRLAPDRADTQVNLGNTLRMLARLPEAETCLTAAVARWPNHPGAAYSLGVLHMITGRLAEGWRGLERRVDCFPQRKVEGRLWQGEALPGGVLLLHSDQGFGDAIQFCRYIPALTRHTHVVLEVIAPLRRLMQSLDNAPKIFVRGETLPHYTAQCPLTRLGYLAGSTLQTVPNDVPYLHPEPAAVAAWRQRLTPLPGLRVGLVWAGNPEHQDDWRRSVALQQLAPLAAVPNVVFVSLQKRLHQATNAACFDQPPPGMQLHDWTEELADFADTAALVSALDLVIAVDTAVVHLAGALGRPVWLLNRIGPCWRWLLDRDDSPWYPTLRQIRQTRPNDWAAPIGAMQAELYRLTAGAGRPSHSG